MIFRDDRSNGPYFMIPSEDEGVILCLYDLEDIGVWLARVDTSQRFTGFPPGSHLGEAVLFSPWKVELGRAEDWQKMYSVLDSMAPEAFKRASVPGLESGHFSRLSQPEAYSEGRESSAFSA